MTAIPEGFTPHDGGPRPVGRYTVVYVLMRSGKTQGPLIADHWDWWGSQHPADIIAYRIAEAGK